MYDADNSSEGGPKGSFEIYKSEGDVLFKQQMFLKAIECYNTALEVKPGNVKCLVARSKCHIQLGNSQAALDDAEETLKEDPNDIRGLLQKAEALYQKGDFEFALVFYHRGNKLRPELQAFRLGIQKSQEAINNSIGENSKRRLNADGDMSYFYEKEEKAKAGKKGGYSKPGQKKEEKQEEYKPKHSGNEKQMKHLLGELYADKCYLEKLLKGTDESTSCNEQTNSEIRDLVIQGLKYLDTRTDFWRQQKPSYQSSRDKRMREKGAKGNKKDPTQFVLKRLEKIDEQQAAGKYQESLKLGEKTLREIEKWSDEDLPNRAEVVANLHSLIGNAHLELQNYPKAEEHHNKDYEIANQQKLEEAKSRALENLGRVYARMGEFKKAIKVWEEKAPLNKSDIESTWLYHEIGRCYLELGEYDKAKENGEKSLESASNASDNVWQLNASVLVAQAEVKLGEYQAALDAFDKSLEMAKAQGDRKAENAIKRAIEEINQAIVKNMKEQNGEKQDDAQDQVQDEHQQQEAAQEEQAAEQQQEEQPAEATQDTDTQQQEADTG